VLIILICGLPGVGKTTLAKELAPLAKAVVLSTDKIRKELIKKPRYSIKERRMVYEIFLLVAKYLHNSGVNCILDATFNRERSRSQVKRSLKISESQIHIVECVCPEEVVFARLHSRKEDYSDADFAVYKKMKKIFEPIRVPHIVVDTRNPQGQNAKIVMRKISGTK